MSGHQNKTIPNYYFDKTSLTPEERQAIVDHPWVNAYIVAGNIAVCSQCHKDTRFIEVNFEAPLHPGECSETMWKKYWEALRETEEKYPTEDKDSSCFS